MVVSLFQHSAFVWVCVSLAGGCLAAAVAVLSRAFWAELAARFLRIPAAGKAALVAFVAVATAVAQKPGNVATDSTDSHGLGGTVLSTDYTDLHGFRGNWPAALNAEETEEERRGENLKKSLDWSVEAVASSPQNPAKETPRLSASMISALSESNSQSVTDEDITRGYRLVEVRTNETVSYEMTTNGTVVGTWHLTDAYEAVVRVGLGTEVEARGGGGERAANLLSVASQQECLSNHSPPQASTSTSFGIPLGRQTVTSLWAHVWGKARPQLKNASKELVAVGAPMFARHGVSRLWTAATTNGTVLLTWEDFFLGNPYEVEARGGGGERMNEVEARGGGGERMNEVEARGGGGERTANFLSAASQQDCLSNHSPPQASTSTFSHPSINAQLELFPSGDFIARSNEVERVYHRVNPDDWDDDGIPNGEDDDPRIAADETQFGPHQDLSVIAHSDNYYWVDLVVPQANALVTFAGDGASNLADPSFVAEAGETNRVVLLLGKPYTVDCPLPLVCAGASHDDVEIGEDEDGRLTVCRPVRCEIVEAPSAAALRASAVMTRAASSSASGGTKGGTFSLELRDGGRLERAGGSFLPREGKLKPGESFKVKVKYRARAASESEGDVKAVVTFTEEDSAEKIESAATLTAIKVEIQPVNEASENKSEWRHKYGVRELIDCGTVPDAVTVSWNVKGNGAMQTDGTYLCPLDAETNPIEVVCGDVTYTPSIQIVEPSSVRALNPGVVTYGLSSLSAGGIGLQLDVQILPLDVSFQGIVVEEVPSTIGLQTGYFTHPYFDGDRCHSRENGAGVWLRVREDNVIDARDTAAYTQEYPRMTPDGQLTESLSAGWIEGENIWSIPFGWHALDTTGETAPWKCFAADETQVFTLDAFGTAGVRKLDHEAVREALGSVYLDGVKLW